jgi:hypothetical protein
MVNTTDITTLLIAFYLSILIGYKSVLNCDIQRLLNKNPYINHLVTFFCCFFLLSIFYQTNESIEKIWLITFITYIFLMLFLKTTTEIVGVVFVLLIIDQNVKMTISSKLQKDPNTDVKGLNKLRNYIFYGNIILVIIGFSLYFLKQRKEHPTDFSYLTFIFGNESCNL